MTKDEEYQLIELAKSGDTAATHKLYNSHHKMIANYCRRYSRLNVLHKDDLVSECYFYFMDAIRKFDISKGYKFSTYLHNQLRQISRYVIQQDSTMTMPADYLQRLKAETITKIEVASLDTPYTFNEDSQKTTWADQLIIDEPIDSLVEEIGETNLYRCLELMDSAEADLLIERYMYQVSQETVAKRNKVGHITIRKVTDVAKQHLKDLLLA